MSKNCSAGKMLPFVHFTLARSTYIDIISDRVHPLKATHATNTIQESLEKRQRARGLWPDRQSPQIPIRLSIHGMQRSHGRRRGPTPTPEQQRDPPLTCKVQHNHLFCPCSDRSELLWQHERDVNTALYCVVSELYSCEDRSALKCYKSILCCLRWHKK